MNNDAGESSRLTLMLIASAYQVGQIPISFNLDMFLLLLPFNASELEQREIVQAS